MYLRIYILLVVSLITQTTTAQQTPPAISKWISAELEKGKNKTLLKDYNADNFFSTDSSRIIGYIKGYDTTLKFTSGTISIENFITREYNLIAVPVHPDGRFELNVKMMHPRRIIIVFDTKYWVPLYIESGQVASLVFDWQLLEKAPFGDAKFNKTILYGGPAAQINEELNSIEPDRPDFSVLHQQVKTLTPDAFKATTQTSWNNARKKLDAQLSGNKYLEHTQVILRNQIDLDYAFVFLEFIRLRESIQKRDTTNKIVVVRESKSFYDFLSKNNFDGRGLLISSNFSSFMERLESSKPYWEPHSRSHFDVERNKSDTTISPQVVRLLQNWQMADTLLPNKYALTPGFLYELSKARSLKFIFESTLKDRKDDGRIYLTQLANGMSHPFLLKESEELFHRKYSNTGRTYTLPDNMSAAFFKSIINRHKGKMLFVDFWATFCAPCISNIRTQLPLRDKYKNNPDFDFIFITSEDDSPLKTYEKFIGEQALKNTYRISEKDFLSIRQLFKFNGIPRYVIIDKEGKVLNDDFRMHNFQYELPKLFPEKEWK